MEEAQTRLKDAELAAKQRAWQLEDTVGRQQEQIGEFEAERKDAGAAHRREVVELETRVADLEQTVAAGKRTAEAAARKLEDTTRRFEARAADTEAVSKAALAEAGRRTADAVARGDGQEAEVRDLTAQLARAEAEVRAGRVEEGGGGSSPPPPPLVCPRLPPYPLTRLAHPPQVRRRVDEVRGEAKAADASHAKELDELRAAQRAQEEKARSEAEASASTAGKELAQVRAQLEEEQKGREEEKGATEAAKGRVEELEREVREVREAAEAAKGRVEELEGELKAAREGASEVRQGRVKRVRRVSIPLTPITTHPPHPTSLPPHPPHPPTHADRPGQTTHAGGPWACGRVTPLLRRLRRRVLGGSRRGGVSGWTGNGRVA